MPSYFSIFATIIALLKQYNFRLSLGEEKQGKWNVKNKEKNMCLNFSSWVRLFWLEIEKNYVLALPFFFYNISFRLLFQFLSVDFAVLGLTSHLHQ